MKNINGIAEKVRQLPCTMTMFHVLVHVVACPTFSENEFLPNLSLLSIRRLWTGSPSVSLSSSLWRSSSLWPPSPKAVTLTTSPRQWNDASTAATSANATSGLEVRSETVPSVGPTWSTARECPWIPWRRTSGRWEREAFWARTQVTLSFQSLCWRSLVKFGGGRAAGRSHQSNCCVTKETINELPPYVPLAFFISLFKLLSEVIFAFANLCCDNNEI